jgi:hypothetical protein
MIRRRHVLPSVSLAEISPEVAKLSRCRLLRNGLSLGSLALLTGCDLSTHSGIDAALWAMLRFNDRVQSVLYSPQRLAETYPASAITPPFRFNAYYPIWEVRPVAENWRLAVTGLVADKTPWTVDRLRGLPQQAQITGTSVSKDGARSGSGAVCRCTSFCAASARICGRVMSPSPALTAIRPV